MSLEQFIEFFEDSAILHVRRCFLLFHLYLYGVSQKFVRIIVISVRAVLCYLNGYTSFILLS